MFDIPNGWHLRPLGEIAQTIMGQSPPSSAVGPYQSGLPFIQGNSEFGALHPTPVLFSSDTPKIAKPGDVLLSVRAPVGEVNIAESQLCIGRGIAALRPTNCDGRFLFFAVCGLAPAFASLSQGSTFDAINGKDLRQIPVMLPPLDEQRRIADVLWSVDDALSQNGLSKDSSEDVLFTYLSEAFADVTGQNDGHSLRPIEEMLDEIIDYRGVPPPKAESGIPLITARNVRFGYLDVEPREFIANESYNTWMRRGIPSEGDILFTTEAPLGNVAEFPGYKAALGQRTITLVPNSKVLNNSYLKWLLLSPPAQNLIQRHATGSTAKGIKQRTFRKLKFNFPPLDKQTEIGAICAEMAKAVAAADASISSIKRVRASLSADLLSGHVRVPE